MYTEEQIRAELNQMVTDLLPYEPKKIILFGSVARGDFTRSTRYPEVVIDVLPHETVGDEDAKEAIQACEEIIETIKIGRPRGKPENVTRP